jgi:hypothetical protein
MNGIDADFIITFVLFFVLPIVAIMLIGMDDEDKKREKIKNEEPKYHHDDHCW